MCRWGWLSELDPNDEIAALPSPVREEPTGGTAAWPEDYRAVKSWSEGMAVLQEAMEEADDADRVGKPTACYTMTEAPSLGGRQRRKGRATAAFRTGSPPIRMLDRI